MLLVGGIYYARCNDCVVVYKKSVKVLATGIEYAAEAFRHVVLGLPLVDDVVGVDDPGHTVQFAICFAILALDHLPVVECQLLVLRLVGVEVNLELAVLADLVEAQRSEPLPHLHAFHLLLGVELGHLLEHLFDLFDLFTVCHGVNTSQAAVEVPEPDLHVEELADVGIGRG